MEMDFLAHLVRFRNSVFCVIALLIIACNEKVELVTDSIVISEDDVHKKEMRSGIFFVDEKPFTGKLIGFYPNKKDTMFVSSYAVGLEDGEWKKFHESGKIFQQRYYSKGSKVGRFSAWWENEKLQMEYFFENDEYEGTCREWSLEGKLIREMNYKKGYEEGSQKQWYDNGEIRSNYIIKDGRRYGLLGTKNCINVADSVGIN